MIIDHKHKRCLIKLISLQNISPVQYKLVCLSFLLEMISFHLPPLNLKKKKDKKTNILKILLRIFKTQQIVFFNFCRTELQGSILFHEFLHFLSEKGRERSGDYGKGGLGEGEE